MRQERPDDKNYGNPLARGIRLIHREESIAECLAGYLLSIRRDEARGEFSHALETIESIPTVVRELWEIQQWRGRLLEKMGCHAQAREVYAAHATRCEGGLGVIRCLVSLGRLAEAREGLAGLAFEPQCVREFVELRALLDRTSGAPDQPQV